MAKKFKSSAPNPLIDSARENPLIGAQDCCSAFDLIDFRRDKKLYELLAGVYAVGYYLARDPGAWRTFVKEPFFGSLKRRPRPVKDAPRAMKFAVRYVFRPSDKESEKQASVYTIALRYYYAKQLRPTAVQEMLQAAGGVDKVRRLAARERKLIKEQKHRKLEEHLEDDPPTEVLQPKNDENDELYIGSGASGDDEVKDAYPDMIELAVRRKDSKILESMKRRPGERAVIRIATMKFEEEKRLVVRKVDRIR